MKERLCKTCKKPFEGHHKKLYCSPECVPKRSHKKKTVKDKPAPEGQAPFVQVPEAVEFVPPTQTTTPPIKDKPEDQPQGAGESEKKPFRGFFYD